MTMPESAAESPHYRICACCKEPVTVPLVGQHNPFCTRCTCWEADHAD